MKMGIPENHSGDKVAYVGAMLVIAQVEGFRTLGEHKVRPYIRYQGCRP